jgi:queuine tRNA-ribosyltransferase
MESIFSVAAQDASTRARTGRMALPHGVVRTPAFMPVGTNGTVKAMTADALSEIGFNLILANTYHLYLRPGTEVIKRAGGLHAFTGWTGNILTDSGGFQVFSLAPFRKIAEDGVTFKSHLDGSAHFLTPERIIEIQAIFGSDILMPLDYCTKYGTDYEEAAKAARITTDWGRRSAAEWRRRAEGGFGGKLFGIIQGNFYKDLREKSAEEILALDTPGIAIGGLSVGESFGEFREFLERAAASLPRTKPRYVMGIGTPEYILAAVENGIDIFDCVFPTRTARNGLFFTGHGPISIKQERYLFDNLPVDGNCRCPACRRHTKAYLRHLYKSGEILYSILATGHNLFFLQALMDGIGESIEQGRFADFKRDFLNDYAEGKDD